MCSAHTHTLVLNDQRDPSRTTALRRVYAADMQRRFEALVKVIKISVVEEDALGLRDNPEMTQISTLQRMTSAGRRAFAFTRDSRKISAFMEWLRRQVESGIIDVGDYNQIGEAINAAWQNKYIHDAYKRGVSRARQQMKQGGMKIPSIEQSGGITAVLATPFHLDRLGVLYTRAFNELRGITGSMEQLISRILTTGLAEGQGMAVIARTLVHAITGAGETLSLPVSYINPSTGRLVNYVMPAEQRALLLARTEIIRAHAQGQLQEFKNWGIVGVNVLAELQTAGDERVCAFCSALEGRTYTIEEASSIIPVHPQCRCIWLPKLLN